MSESISEEIANIGIMISREANSSIGAGIEMTDAMLLEVRGEDDHLLAHQDRERIKQHVIRRAITSAEAVRLHTLGASTTGQKKPTSLTRRLRNRLPSQHL